MRLTDEVMRGDWLYYKGRMNAFSFQVEQITKKKFGYHAEPGENRMYYLRPCECYPIPLTEKILQRNGFGYTERDGELNHFYLGNSHYCENMDLHIGNEGEDFWVNYLNHSVWNIHYVHELQHVFKLCKIEMKIEL